MVQYFALWIKKRRRSKDSHSIITKKEQDALSWPVNERYIYSFANISFPERPINDQKAHFRGFFTVH